MTEFHMAGVKVLIVEWGALKAPALAPTPMESFVSTYLMPAGAVAVAVEVAVALIGGARQWKGAR